MLRRIGALFITLGLFCLSGCNSQKTIETEIIGNADAKNTYYSSYSLTLDSGDIASVIDMGDSICVVSCLNPNDESDFTYTFTMIDKDSHSVSSSNTAVLQKYAVSYCSTPDNKLVLSNATGYYIVDPLTGDICADEMVRGMFSGETPVVARDDDGFVFITPETIYKITSDGKITDSIDMMVDGDYSWNNTYFVQNGHRYLVTTETIFSHFYEVDFDSHTVELKLDGKDIDIEAGYLYEHTRYCYDIINGEIYEINVEGASKEILAYTNNMLIKPCDGYEMPLYILSGDCFVQVNTFDSGMSEVTMIRRDDTLDLGSREIITVAGDYVIDDKSLAMAVYQYNSSQNEFFVKIESWGDDYRWSTSKDAEARNLRLIQRMQNGDAPDILYGCSLDFNNLGKLGIVQDMMPYIKNSSVITKDKLNDHLYDLMTKDGHCYQLFNGYAFNGFCGNVLQGEYEGMDFYSNEANKDNLQYKYNSVDMLNFMLGYPLEQLSSADEFISEDQVSAAIESSTALGLNYMANETPAPGDVSIGYGLYGSIPGLLKVSDNGSFEFYGFPTYGGNTYCVETMGLTALSSGSKNPEACIRFLEFLYSYDSQRCVLSSGYFPMSDEVYSDYKDKMRDPDSIPREDYGMRLLAQELIVMKGGVPSYREIPDCFWNDLERTVNSVNKVMYVDFAIYNILTDELNSYYLQGKEPKDIAVSLRSRLMLYIKENDL